MTRRILRWEVPVDDQDHELEPGGPVVHVAAHRDFPGRVEVWTLDPSDEEFWAAPIGTRVHARAVGPARVFRVFGTGQPIPDGYVYLRSTERTVHGLVWHLFARLPDRPTGILRFDGALNQEQADAMLAAFGQPGVQIESEPIS